LGRRLGIRERGAAGAQIFGVGDGVRLGGIWKFRQGEHLPYKLRLMGGTFQGVLFDTGSGWRLGLVLGYYRLAACITLRLIPALESQATALKGAPCGVALGVCFFQFFVELEFAVVGFGEGLFQELEGMIGLFQPPGVFSEEIDTVFGSVGPGRRGGGIEIGKRAGSLGSLLAAAFHLVVQAQGAEGVHETQMDAAIRDRLALSVEAGGFANGDVAHGAGRKGALGSGDIEGAGIIEAIHGIDAGDPGEDAAFFFGGKKRRVRGRGFILRSAEWNRRQQRKRRARPFVLFCADGHDHMNKIRGGREGDKFGEGWFVGKFPKDGMAVAAGSPAPFGQPPAVGKKAYLPTTRPDLFAEGERKLYTLLDAESLSMAKAEGSLPDQGENLLSRFRAEPSVSKSRNRDILRFQIAA
jgi:hypothetical protein